MPITIQTEVFEDLQNLSRKVKGPEVVQELARTASEAMIDAAPVGQYGDAGLLSRTLSEVSGPEPREGGWWAGVGNLEGIYPLKPAPRDTIKNFLELIGKKKKGGKETPPPKPKKGEGTSSIVGLSDYERQYAKATAWQERNRSKTEAAFWLLFKEGEKSTGASKAKLNRARRLLDIDRAIRRKYHGGK